MALANEVLLKVEPALRSVNHRRHGIVRHGQDAHMNPKPRRQFARDLAQRHAGAQHLGSRKMGGEVKVA